MANKQYPIIDGHRKHYVLHPVQKTNGKWVSAEVLIDGKGGYISPEGNPLKHEFRKEEDCQKACDIHNTFHGWDKEKANAIIAKSMNLSVAG